MHAAPLSADPSLLLPSDELTRLAARHPRLALEILAHPGLSLRGLEAIVANLLPFGPRPAHALAAASNPAMPLWFLTEPGALVPVWSLLLGLGQAALTGALHVARHLPWSARHELEVVARELPSGAMVFGEDSVVSALAPDASPLEAIVPRVFRRDVRFRVAHAVLDHAATSETLAGLHRGVELFARLSPLGVSPPPLWQRVAQSL